MSGDGPGPVDSDEPKPFSLQRWSQRKLALARNDAGEAATATEPDRVAVERTRAGTGRTMPGASQAQVTGHAAAEASPPQVASAALPPVDSLTKDSDFTPFMRPGVDAVSKRGALKKLFSDPRFNIMDGLDVYIDDYTKSDPIDPSLAQQLLARMNSALGVAQPPAEDATVQPLTRDADVLPLTVGAATQPLTPGATTQPPPADAPSPATASAGESLALVGPEPEPAQTADPMPEGRSAHDCATTRSPKT
jgi:hypothetical protein